MPAENFACKIFFGKNGQPLCGFPSGGFSCRTAAYGRFGSLLCRIAAVMRGVAYYAQPIFDFPNISEEISENQGAQLKRICFLIKQQQPRGAKIAPRGKFFINYFKFTLNVYFVLFSLALCFFIIRKFCSKFEFDIIFYFLLHIIICNPTFIINASYKKFFCEARFISAIFACTIKRFVSIDFFSVVRFAPPRFLTLDCITIPAFRTE